MLGDEITELGQRLGRHVLAPLSKFATSWFAASSITF
jgi:hypothetical protein